MTRLRGMGRPPVRRAGGPGRVVLLCIAALALAGCGERGCGCVVAKYYRSSADTLQTRTQEFGLRWSKQRTETRPAKANGMPAMLPLDKVHPLVRTQIAGVDSATIDSFLVTFVDTIGPAVRTLGLSKGDLAQALTSRRAAVYDSLADLLGNRYSAERISAFVLIHALFLRMPVGLVDSLAREPNIIRIEPMFGGPPPQEDVCGSTMQNMTFARDHVGSDAYIEAGYGGGGIALFDTGVYTDHALILEGGHVREAYDCDENGCVLKALPQMDVWSGGHGTASAAILAGETPPGANGENSHMHDGLTKATLYSYNVYGNSSTGVEVNLPAAAHALDMAAFTDVDLFVAEIATTKGGPGAISQSAGVAFGEGQMIIAANGNTGSALHSPADGPHVLGVGAYCSYSNRFKSEYVSGKTADGRWKPDFTGPTSTYTAAYSKSDPGAMGIYDGTSGATPYAGAAALLLRNRMRSGLAEAPLPGNVYAALLLAADSDGTLGAKEGAGRVRLPNDGAMYWGTLEVAEHQAWTIPIEIDTDGAATMEALIWWPRADPEPSVQQTTEWRSDIDLALKDASGNELMKSDSAEAVRERVFGEIPAGSAGKWWAVDIYGYAVPGGVKQAVYWAVWIRHVE